MSGNKLKLRRASLTEWLQEDPVLLDGEMALVSTITEGNYDVHKVGDGTRKFSELPFYGTSEGVKRVLTPSADGNTDTFVLPEAPLPATLTVEVNGIRRTGFTLSGTTVILPFKPSVGSIVTANYFIKLSQIVTSDTLKLLEFREAFITTNKVLTTDDDELILADNGEYIVVDNIN